MLLLYGAFVVCLSVQVTGQLFGGPMLRFGFDFPGFTAPEAFENEGLGGFDGIGGIQERIAKLLKGAGKSRPGVKTKVNTQHKGNTNVTTVEQKGKGFNSWARLTTYEDGNKTGGRSFSNMLSEVLGGSSNQDEGKKKSGCSGEKPCRESSYCDPVEGVCKSKLNTGDACFFKNQCKQEDRQICIWGRCSSGTAGQAGTFCQSKKDCADETYCTLDSRFSIFQPLCKPKLSEGASCGNSHPLRMFKFVIGKRSIEEEQPNPCQRGLKCRAVGLFGGKACVPEDLPTEPSQEDTEGKEDNDLKDIDEEASSGDNEIDEKDDNNQGGDIVTSEEKEDGQEKPDVPKQGEGGEEQGEQQKPGGQPPTVKPKQQPNNPDLGQKVPDNDLPYPPPARKVKKNKKRKNKKKRVENIKDDNN